MKKLFFILFRLVLIVNFIAGILLVVSDKYDDEVNIALAFYVVFVLVISALLNEIESDYYLLEQEIRKLDV